MTRYRNPPRPGYDFKNPLTPIVASLTLQATRGFLASVATPPAYVPPTRFPCKRTRTQRQLAREERGARSFFFYIRERGKKNHRFSLRSTRRQLYESLPSSSTFNPRAVSLPTCSTDTPSATHPPSVRSGPRRRYYLFRKLTPGRGGRDWKILRSFAPCFPAFINRRHSPG